MSRLGSLAWLFAFVALGACARGGAADGADDTDDTTDQTPDDDDDDALPIDAAPRIDSPPPIDSPLPIDSPPPIDGAIDAPTAQPDACVPGSTQFLTNPGFDTGPGTWQEVPITDPDGVPFPIVVTAPTGFPAQTPGYIAWLGGIFAFQVQQFSVTDEIYQIVGIAPGATGLMLSGYWAVDTAEAADGDATDTFTLEIRSTTGALLQQILVLNNTAQVNPAWTAFSVPITANIAGQNVRIRATSTNDLTLATSFFLDSLSLSATAPCP